MFYGKKRIVKNKYYKNITLMWNIMNRIKTGIKGFDSLIEGGFPEGRSILLSGGTGTGKTIMAMQFLIEGAENGEPGIYLTMDERPELIREDMLKFGWNLRDYSDKGLIHIVDGTITKIGVPSKEEYSLPASGFDIDKLLLELMRTIKKSKAKRVVIDSIAALGMNFESEHEVRKAVLKIIYFLSKTGVTTVLTTEIGEKKRAYSKYGVEEYICDGLIVLNYMGLSTQSNRTLHIRKMRATKHSEDIHPIKINDNGIKIFKVEDDY